MYSLFFFSSLLRYSFGMPAKALIPALFALGLVLQWLMLRFAKGRKRFLPAFLFLAVVVAQSVKEGEGKVGTWDSEDQVTGERRGIALVWRDPFKTGTNAHHEMMVRMFRYLND